MLRLLCKGEKNLNSKELALAVCRILSDKKATDILKIDVADKTILADYYVIATGRSLTHVRSLAENLEEELDKLGSSPLRREGVREGRWAALDYGDVIVHIFNDESRLFYHLERLWDNGENTEKMD